MKFSILKHHILILLYTICLPGFAQSNIDSLENLFATSKTDIDKINLLNQLSESSKRISPRKTIEYAQKAIQIASRSNEEILLAISLENAGDGWLIIGKLDTALIYYKKSFTIFDKHQNFKGLSEVYLDFGNIYYFNAVYDSAAFFYTKSVHFKEDLREFEGLIRLYNNLGSVYKKTGETTKAIDALKNALAICEKIKNTTKKGSVLINLSSISLTQGNVTDAMKYNTEAFQIGQKINDLYTVSNAYTNFADIYTFIEDFDKALEYQQKALEIDHKLEDWEGIITAFNNIGLIYLGLEKSDSALFNFNKSYNLHKTKSVIIDFEYTNYNLGLVYQKMKNYKKALKLFDQSLKTSIQVNDVVLIMNNQLAIAEIYTETGDLGLAENYIKKCLILSQSNNFQNEYKIFEILSVINQKKGDYINAYHNYKLYSNLKDSVLNLEQTGAVAKIKAKFDLEAHLDTIKSLSQVNESQLEKIQKHVKMRNVLIAGFIMLLIILILSYSKLKSNKVLRKQFDEIILKNEEIEHQTETLTKINSELEKLSIVASKTDNAILISNPSGDIEWINEGYKRMYGYTFDEYLRLRGKTYFEASTCANINEIYQKVLTEKKSQIYENDMYSKEGKRFRIHTTLTPILDDKNEVVKLIAIDSDITKLKEVETELQKLLLTKDKFFSIIAHDLKNPFNSLIGLSQLLVNGYERMSPEKIKYFHNNLYQISQNGYELLINLLEWSRSQMGRIEYKPESINLYNLTLETYTLYDSKATEKEIQFINNISQYSEVMADINMLKTILRNLVSNALKFTDRGGVIEISEKIKTDFKEIQVRDTGVGIEKENIEKLFTLDENYTTEGTEEETGTGLGLILCKEFVEKQGGKIWVESKVGFGTQFIFTLPLK